MSSSNPTGMQARGDGDGAFLVGGIDETVELFGCVGSDFEQAYVIDDDEVGAGRPRPGKELDGDPQWSPTLPDSKPSGVRAYQRSSTWETPTAPH